jgi:Ca2+-binding RTX toxin-like protein
MEPIGVNKILVEKYGYEWVNGKAWRPGTAPEPEIPTVDVTPGPLPDWITAPPADAFVTQALETLTNPITGEEFTVPTGGYTVNVSASEDSDVPSTEPTIPVTTPETDPVPSEPISLEERIEQLQASINELQKKYEEALEKLEQANARIAELEGQQSETSSEGSNSDEVAVEPDETPSPEPQQPTTGEEVGASTPEAPEVSEPEPTPAPSYPEPTGVDKILVENYGYEWVNGKAWPAGTAPNPEVIQVEDQTLIGTEGDDILTGGAGNDTLEGGAGNDTLDGGAGNDILDGSDGNDRVEGGSGNDTIWASWGDDFEDGGEGVDTLAVVGTASSISDVTFNLATGSQGVTGEVLTEKAFVNIENFRAGFDASDKYLGSDWNYTIIGSSQNNRIETSEGNDELSGAAGDDILIGNGGNDTLDGGAGNDTLDGGVGNDTYKYAYNGITTISDASGIDTLHLTTRDADGNSYWGDGGYFLGDDLIISSNSNSSNKLVIKDAKITGNKIEKVTYYAADNSYSSFSLNIAHIGEVSDTESLLYFGTLGNDSIITGSAYAEVYLNDGDDVATLGNNGGWARGGNGNDTLIGGSGNDILDGGGGNDIISGGAGADTFKFSDGFGNDTITDFEDGVDTLEYIGSVTIGSSADGYKMYTAEDGSTLTLNGVAAPNPNHYSFTSGENNFTLVSSAKSYQDAVDYASGMGGTLATFNSSTKFDGFYDAVSNVISSENLIPTTAADGGGAKYVWLGATDQLNEGTWIWENGSQMTFDNWGSGTYGSEPDNFNNQDGLALGLENWPTGSADGAGFGDAGYWNDIDTSNELYFVVEIA